MSTFEHTVFQLNAKSCQSHDTSGRLLVSNPSCIIHVRFFRARNKDTCWTELTAASRIIFVARTGEIFLSRGHRQAGGQDDLCFDATVVASTFLPNLPFAQPPVVFSPTTTAILEQRLTMKYLVVFFLVLLIGCGTTQPLDTPRDQPEVISMAPLPSYPSTVPLTGLRFTVMLHVMENGTVGEASMIGTSGAVDWDSMAIQSIKLWKFQPAKQNGRPVASWLRQAVVVQIQEPIVLYLGELVLPRQESADSLYALLTNGMSFEALAMQSVAASHDHGGYLGAVNIAIFPKPVRERLKDLRIGELLRRSDSGVTTSSTNGSRATGRKTCRCRKNRNYR